MLIKTTFRNLSSKFRLHIWSKIAGHYIAITRWPEQIVHSPSGRYSLRIWLYSADSRYSNYSIAKVYLLRGKKPLHIATLFRAYPIFYHGWVEGHPGTHRDYLLWGSYASNMDMLDLNTGVSQSKYDGSDEFCPRVYHPSPDGQHIALQGCYWAAPDDIRILDFTNPSVSPLPVLHTFECVGDELFGRDTVETDENWIDENTFSCYAWDIDASQTTRQTWRKVT